MSCAFDLLKMDQVCKAEANNPRADVGEFVVLNDAEVLPRGRVVVDERLSCCAVSRGFVNKHEIDYHSYTSRDNPYEILSGVKFSAIGTALLPVRLHGSKVVWFLRVKVMPYDNLQRYDVCGRASEDLQFDLVLGQTYLKARDFELDPVRVRELDEQEYEREHDEAIKPAEAHHNLRIRAVNV